MFGYAISLCISIMAFNLVGANISPLITPLKELRNQLKQRKHLDKSSSNSVANDCIFDFSGKTLSSAELEEVLKFINDLNNYIPTFRSKCYGTNKNKKFHKYFKYKNNNWTIKLVGCALDNSHAKVITNFINLGARISKLELNHNNIGKSGVKKLIESSIKSTIIENINLMWNAKKYILLDDFEMPLDEKEFYWTIKNNTSSLSPKKLSKIHYGNDEPFICNDLMEKIYNIKCSGIKGFDDMYMPGVKK